MSHRILWHGKLATVRTRIEFERRPLCPSILPRTLQPQSSGYLPVPRAERAPASWPEGRAQPIRWPRPLSPSLRTGGRAEARRRHEDSLSHLIDASPSSALRALLRLARRARLSASAGPSLSIAFPQGLLHCKAACPEARKQERHAEDDFRNSQ
jgi:hypothetical protein